MLLCREQREIFSIVLTLPFCSFIVLHVLFINIVVCKNQIDNLLQVFSIVRVQLARKLHIQKRFKRGGVCVSV